MMYCMNKTKAPYRSEAATDRLDPLAVNRIKDSVTTSIVHLVWIRGAMMNALVLLEQCLSV